MKSEHGAEVALVTGASGGIGAAIARRLAVARHPVVVTARDAARLDDLLAELRADGAAAHGVALDVTDPASVRRAVEQARALQLGPIDWLVNNAGIAETAPLLPREGSDPEALYRRHLEVNFHGARRMVEALVPAMVERGSGAVVQVASSAGLVGYPYASAYCASKFALVGYTRAAAAELAGRGVRFGLVCPHYVDTPLLARSIERVVRTTGKTPEEARAFFASQNPGGRLVTPDEVAAVVVAMLRGDEPAELVELDGTPR